VNFPDTSATGNGFTQQVDVDEELSAQENESDESSGCSDLDEANSELEIDNAGSDHSEAGVAASPQHQMPHSDSELQFSIGPSRLGTLTIDTNGVTSTINDVNEDEALAALPARQFSVDAHSDPFPLQSSDKKSVAQTAQSESKQQGSRASSASQNDYQDAEQTSSASASIFANAKREYIDQIRLGNKTREGRIARGKFASIKPGDTVSFGARGHAVLSARVTDVRRYSSFQAMLSEEGHLKQYLPSATSIGDGAAAANSSFSNSRLEIGVATYHGFKNYAQLESEHGVVGFGLELVDLSA